MRKLLIAAATFLSVLAFSPQAWSSTIYFKQTASGAGTGASCTDARAYTSIVNGDWTGNNLHQCGTITVPNNTIAFNVGGDNATLTFEPGAILQSGIFPYAGAAAGGITCIGHTNFTIDGGGNGIMRNTANGTGLANHANSIAIFNECSNFTIRNNLTVTNVFVRTEDQPSQDGDTTIGIYSSGTNTVIDGNTVNNSRYGIYMAYCNITNGEIKNNVLSFVEHGINVGAHGSGCSLAGLLIHDNDIGGGAYLWDQGTATDNNFHHDPIHLHSMGTPSSLTGVQVYRNYIHGIWGRDATYFAATGGSHITAYIFLEQVGDGLQVHDNVIVAQGAMNQGGNGTIFLKGSGTSGQRSQAAIVVNNTVVDDGHGFAMECQNNTGHRFENNIFSRTAYAIYTSQGACTPAVSDFNVFWGIPTQGYGDSFGSLAQWQARGFDIHSSTGDPKLNGSFQPQGGSSALGLGANLTFLGIASLDVDKLLNARPPAPTNWAAGAYQVAGSTSIIPNPPTGLTAVPH